MAEGTWYGVRLDIKLDDVAYCEAFGLHPDDIKDDLATCVAEAIHEYLAQTVGKSPSVAGHVAHTDWYVDGRAMLKWWQADRDSTRDSGAWITVMDCEEDRKNGKI